MLEILYISIKQKSIRYKMVVGLALFVFLFAILMPMYQAQGFHNKEYIVPCGTEVAGHTQDCTVSLFIVLISNIIFFLIQNIALPVAVISFTWAGWLYLTAGGDSGQIEQAHKIFRYVILGLLLALGAWLIVKGILRALDVAGTEFDVLN